MQAASSHPPPTWRQVSRPFSLHGHSQNTHLVAGSSIFAPYTDTANPRTFMPCFPPSRDRTHTLYRGLDITSQCSCTQAADTDTIVCKQGHINLATSANADILLFYLGWVFRVPLLPQVSLSLSVCVCVCVCLAVRVDGSESEPLRVCLYRCLCFWRLTFRVPLPLVP